MANMRKYISIDKLQYYSDKINELCNENTLDTLYEIHKYINTKPHSYNSYTKKSTKCPNCGAPITSSKCDYCGTDFKQAMLYGM